jgi:alkylation response protein AidB-like acyl-CoA dehydrogenase
VLSDAARTRREFIVQFVHTEEQRLIRDSARALLSERAGSAQLRAALSEPGGYDRELWRTMAELGWTGLALPEDCGGAGLGWVELCILLEEQGRLLVPSPFFVTSALAAPLIAASASEAQRRALLTRIARGEARIACALSDTDGRPPPEGIGVSLQMRAGGFSLSGVSDFVIHADSADLLLVLARAQAPQVAQVQSAEGISVVVIPAASAGVTIHPHVMLDLTRPMSRVELHGVAVEPQQILVLPWPRRRSAARSACSR